MAIRRDLDCATRAIVGHWWARPSLYVQGVAGYTQNGRSGDYPAMAADPSSATAVWTPGEYAASSGA
jgi:hypothetical protein